MTYVTGMHPHIRSAETVAGRYWTASALLFPCIILKIISAWPQLFSFLSLGLAAAAVHFASGFLRPQRPQQSGWHQGILPLFISLWFLIIPVQVSFAASVSSFAFALFFIYEFPGGLGAYPIHPVPAGILFLSLFFPHENLTAFADPGNFNLWNALVLLFLAFGGFYLGAQKKIRLMPAFFFMGSVLLFIFSSGRPIDLELLCALFIFGFYIVTDSNVSPLKANTHLLTAAGAGICAAGLILLGAGVLPAYAISLAAWNLVSHA